jgi:hypothetical protein
MDEISESKRLNAKRYAIEAAEGTPGGGGGGYVLNRHHSHNIEKNDQDGQHGHIISTCRVSLLPADHPCNNQGLPNIYKFTIIIL